jgi:hypothetical protein
MHNIAGWLTPGGNLFLHISANRSIPYLLEVGNFLCMYWLLELAADCNRTEQMVWTAHDMTLNTVCENTYICQAWGSSWVVVYDDNAYVCSCKPVPIRNSNVQH